MRSAAVLLGLAFALYVPEQADASARSLRGVRYSVDGTKTRVVIDCDAHFEYRLVPFHRPERLAVNLPGIKAPSRVRNLTIRKGVVVGVRINRLSWGSQVVMDLKGAASWKDFRLKPNGKRPHRIVIDLWKSPGGAKSAQAAPRPILIAVDAGHGGEDPGATGRYHLVEKEVALDIAKRMVRIIDARNGYRATLVRKGDRFLTLPQRTDIAKRREADAFVSIHLNSARNRSARGVELFFLSPSGAAAKAKRILRNKKQAARELGLDDPKNEDVLYMLLDVNQKAMMLRSSMLAESILKAMQSEALPPARGIKQRSFAVLKAISMPSVMVEAGFLTNSADARLLKSAKGREDIAEAVCTGIFKYFDRYPPARGTGSKVLVHKVRRGESLWKIARKYRTTIGELKKINKLGNSNKIQIGQRLLVYQGR